MNKNSFIISVLLLSCLAFCSCSQEARDERDFKKNASNYCSEKYNIEIDEFSNFHVFREENVDNSDSRISDMYIEVKDENGDEFSIREYWDGRIGDNKKSSDYKKGVEELIAPMFSGAKAVKFDIEVGYEGYVDADINSVEELMADDDTNIIVIVQTVGFDIDSISQEDVSKLGKRIVFSICNMNEDYSIEGEAYIASEDIKQEKCFWEHYN